MKIRPYSLIGAYRAIGMGITVLALILGSTAFSTVFGEESDSAKKQEPIRITADKLVTDNANRSAQFSGNVKVVQGNTVITADRLLIFYTSADGSSSAAPGSNIERLKAEGNVRIEFDNKVAVSNQAVYIVAERKLVLSGPGSKVVSGQDEISGSKITFFRDNGQVILEGDAKNRVNAIIHSDHQGLN